jgi:hypothetical protein
MLPDVIRTLGGRVGDNAVRFVIPNTVYPSLLARGGGSTASINSYVAWTVAAGMDHERN